MAPFRKNMARLAELYYQQTGRHVSLYPVAIHLSKTIRVGRSILYSPFGQPSAERLRIKNYLELAVRVLYLQSENGLPVETPLPEG